MLSAEGRPAQVKLKATTAMRFVAVKHKNPDAVDVMYKRGDLVWYRQRDGTDVPAKVSTRPVCTYARESQTVAPKLPEAFKDT